MTKYGIVTRNPEELTWDDFAVSHFEVKGVNGQITKPEAGSTSVIACFGDTARSVANPALVPVDQEGNAATRNHEQLEWGYICPSHQEYRDQLLELIAEVTTVTSNIRLDEVGFPNATFCHCDSCKEQFAAAVTDSWNEWRQQVITSFLERARNIVPGKLLVSLHPDPYPGHSEKQTGISLDSITPLVDEFVIPLYDESYTTTYWVEIITQGFASRLTKPFSVELFAGEASINALVETSETVESYASTVIFGYDGAQARAAVRRIRANETTGTSHHPAEK